jgi:hypothetical protein
MLIMTTVMIPTTIMPISTPIYHPHREEIGGGEGSRVEVDGVVGHHVPLREEVAVLLSRVPVAEGVVVPHRRGFPQACSGTRKAIAHDDEVEALI